MAIIKIRRGTAAQWTASNRVLQDGELGYETDTKNLKVGDGTTAWNSLAYTIEGTAAAITAASIGALETETTTSLSLAANILSYTDETGATTDLDLSLYLDDTNLARVQSGHYDRHTGIATFKRDDSTTFTLDLSDLIGESFNLSVAADDSTQRTINAGETLSILGGDRVTTSSDAEGAITITASDTFDLKGSVFADDSSLMVDAVNNVIVAPVEGGVTGDVQGNVTGDVTGNLTGDVTGNVTGNLSGNAAGDHTGTFTGYHTGDMTGSVFADDSTLLVDAVNGVIVGPYQGDVIGNLTGNVTGNVTGDVSGEVTGDLYGSVFAEDSIRMVDNINNTFTGDLTGDVTGNLTGDVTSDGANTMAQLTTTGDITVGGNLTVQGTTTTVETTNTTISDVLIELGTGQTGAPNTDSGIVIERGSETNAFIGFDESEDKFIVGTGSFTGSSTGNLTITTGTLIANIEGTITSSNISGTGGTIDGVVIGGTTPAAGTFSTLKVSDLTSGRVTYAGADGELQDSTNLTFDGTTLSSTFSGNLTGNVTGTVSDISNHTTDNLAEGSSNLYYTQGRFDTAFSAKSTTDLSEGTNLYYTDGRVRAAVSATNGTAGYNSGTGVFSIPSTTDHVSEGTNLYYTDARVDTHLNSGTASSGEVLSWTGSDYDWISNAQTLSGLTDTNISSPSSGQHLLWTGSNWEATYQFTSSGTEFYYGGIFRRQPSIYASDHKEFPGHTEGDAIQLRDGPFSGGWGAGQYYISKIDADFVANFTDSDTNFNRSLKYRIIVDNNYIAGPSPGAIVINGQKGDPSFTYPKTYTLETGDGTQYTYNATAENNRNFYTGIQALGIPGLTIGMNGDDPTYTNPVRITYTPQYVGDTLELIEPADPAESGWDHLAMEERVYTTADDGSYFSPGVVLTGIQFGGSTQSFSWVGGSAPTGRTGQYDIYDISMYYANSQRTWFVEHTSTGTLDTNIVTGDLQGSVFAEDSTLMIDAQSGTIVGPVVSDLTGSVYADDSTQVIDGTTGFVTGKLAPATGSAPTLAGDPGETGEIRFDDTNMYLKCPDGNWRKVALASL